MSQLLAKATAGIAVLALAACSGTPATTTESKARTEAAPAQAPPAPAGPVTAKTAFFEMYKPARAWAADFALLSLVSNDVPGIAGAEGKSGMWTAVFVSPSRREARTFTYSVADSESDIHKGVSDGGGQGWSGATPASQPFQTMEWTVDSDAAYRAALAKADAWVKQHPGKKASFTLGNAARFPTPVWYVLWGNKQAGYGVFVSASTGTVLKAK